MTYRFIFMIMILIMSPGSGVTESRAQSDQAFKCTTLSLQGFYNTNANEFHQFWHPGQGLGIAVTFPFYLGQFMAETNALEFHGRNSSITDFRTFQIYAGWGQSVTILPRVKWLNGIALGNNFMVFAAGDASRGVKTESEFGLTLKSQLDYFIGPNWSVTAGLQRQLLFTYKRIRLTFVSLAFSYSFNTPHWLKEFMR